MTPTERERFLAALLFYRRAVVRMRGEGTTLQRHRNYELAKRAAFDLYEAARGIVELARYDGEL